MSGGRWDYLQDRIREISDSIEDEIVRNNDAPNPENWWRSDPWPGYNYPDEVIEEFKKAHALLLLAETYAQRADWLLSGDDGEESFLKRLKEDVENLIKTDKYGYIEKIWNSLK